MSYVNQRQLGVFESMDPDDVVNGSLASSSLFTRIADNLQWLFTQDVECINTGPLPDDKTIPLLVNIPPYCQWMEAAFLCKKTDTAGDIDLKLEVSGVDERFYRSLPVNQMGWVYFSGDPIDDMSGGILKLLNSPEDIIINGAFVNVIVPPGLTVYNMYYRVLPPTKMEV